MQVTHLRITELFRQSKYHSSIRKCLQLQKLKKTRLYLPKGSSMTSSQDALCFVYFALPFEEVQ